MDLDAPPHIASLLPEDPVERRGHWSLQRIPISRLLAAIMTEDSSSVHMVPVEMTPHYRLLHFQDEAPYRDYAAATAPQKSGDEWVREYRQLEASFDYLKYPDHAGEYITVSPSRASDGAGYYRILDGLHRVALLHARGVTSVLCAVLHSAYDPARALQSFLREFRDDFLEWYQPLGFNTDIAVHSRTFPHFVSMLDVDPSRGRAKWDHVIRDTIPDVRDKVVYDVGCNAGLFTMELARLGASRVVGIDRNEDIVQPTNVHLPKQNVVNQAYFVRRAFELADGCAYDNVEFTAADIATYRFDEIEADVVCAFCVFYHLGEARYLEALQQLAAAGVGHVVLQASHDHPPPLGDISSLANARSLLERAGFEIERVASPDGYGSPIIVGRL
jgi:SAM-dependent methyltransferase